MKNTIINILCVSTIILLSACSGSISGTEPSDRNQGVGSSMVGSGLWESSAGSSLNNITEVEASNSDYTGAIYYVSTSEGSDGNTGTSSDAPWETINKVNQADLEPRDAVLFKSGDTWRTADDTAIKITDSGVKTGVGFEDETFDNYITLSAYGNGGKPRMLGSDRIEGWTETGIDNVWTAASIDYNTHAKGKVRALVFEYADGSYDWGLYRTYLVDLTEDFAWMYSNNALYLYSEDDPDEVFSSIESGYTPKLIQLNSMD